MIAYRLVLLPLAVLGLAAPAFAAPDTTSVPAPAAPAPPQENMVCKRERQLGSNLTTKVCQTEAQWQAESSRSKESRKRPNQ